ncbi:13058_t:CDS:2 [Funneliformis geosporum]|uniref:13576_t:CDS:1 n=1 Tax=Funneliformis geosporum TaxID=1117311 RepID=A0A9W4WPY3_9GLOM|nr:13058_t:CDS:2 [Funneliformis geosporum]CAI2178254.1 13576_t:CDS:2 [Funneliformis geosporum]
MTDFIGYTYAFTVALGGVIGFLKAGSMVSLMAGLSFGGLAAYAANRVSTNPKSTGLALVVSLTLFIVMGVRFYKSGKFMPAGLVTIIR